MEINSTWESRCLMTTRDVRTHFSAKNKRVTSRTQNNATNAYNFNSAPNNNNKSNSNLAVPFYAYFTDNDTRAITNKMTMANGIRDD